jgi:Uma2 family endonuclease
MAEAGILDVDDRVELIDGEVVEMNPIGSRQAACVARLNRLFSTRVLDQAIVWVQNSVRLSGHSELQPDLALLEPRDDFYAHAHPTPMDVLLLVEVADTSGAYDRGLKLPLYAAAEIPEVWVIDLSESVVESFRSPTSGQYRERRVFRDDDELIPYQFRALSIGVAEII